MPSPSTAYDLIKDAMRSIGVTTAGETPTSEESNDALSSLNDILELMSTENLFVYGQADQSFNLVAGQSTYTIGTGGNFNTTRPVRIHNAYAVYNLVSFPVQIIGQQEYDLISLKTAQQQQYPERLLWVNDYPLGIITLWPVPSAVIPLVLTMDRVMTQIPTLATVLTYPPGYYLYLKSQLGLMIAPDYGITPERDSVVEASNAKAAIKRANRKRNVATFDLALANRWNGTWQGWP